MKRDLCFFAAGALSGGALTLLRCRIFGAAKVLFGRAEAVAKADAAALLEKVAPAAAPAEAPKP